MIRLKLAGILLLTFFYCSANAEIIDVTDDSSSTSKVTVTRKNTSNEQDSGIQTNENKRVVQVHHDKQKGVYHGDNTTQDGLKLEGVSKQDLEDIYYGTKMHESGY